MGGRLQIGMHGRLRRYPHVSGKISFLISAGYFRSARRFFLTSDFHDRDIAYVAARLGIDGSRFDHAAYSARTRQRHRPQIMELAGFRPFDGDAARALQTELETMARSHSGPAQIFWRAVDWLVSKRIEIPTSFRLTEAVSRAVQQRGRAIAKLIAEAMTSEVRLLLDSMFLRDENAAGQSPFRLTLLKRLSQSTRPTKIRERLEDLGVMKELHAKVEPILSVLNLGSEGIRYFAGSVARMRTTDLRRRADENIQVHLVAFIAHQYYRLHDNLVDVLLTSVRTFENATLREHRDWCFDQRKRHEHATEGLLDDLDTSVFQILRQIREAVADGRRARSARHDLARKSALRRRAARRHRLRENGVAARRRRRPARRRTFGSGRRDDADQLCRAHSSETKRRVELIAKVSLPERQNSEHVGFAFVVTERREHSIGSCN